MRDSNEAAAPDVGAGWCDLCGLPIPSSTQLFSLVPDSSAIHPDDPEQDGQRLLAACGPECLGVLQQRYRQRPYVREELWAGKIARALDAHPEGLDEAGLVRATGLNIIQIEHTLSWESERFLRQQTHSGDHRNPGQDVDVSADDADESG